MTGHDFTQSPTTTHLSLKGERCQHRPGTAPKPLGDRAVGTRRTPASWQHHHQTPSTAPQSTPLGELDPNEDVPLHAATYRPGHSAPPPHAFRGPGLRPHTPKMLFAALTLFAHPAPRAAALRRALSAPRARPISAERPSCRPPTSRGHPPCLSGRSSLRVLSFPSGGGFQTPRLSNRKHHEPIGGLFRRRAIRQSGVSNTEASAMIAWEHAPASTRRRLA